SRRCRGSNCANACARAWARMPCTACRRVPTIVRSVPRSVRRMFRYGTRRRRPAPLPVCARAGSWRNPCRCAGRCPGSSPGPSASRAAGGTAMTCAATTTLRDWPAGRTPGYSARSAAAASCCTAGSHELRRAALPVELQLPARGIERARTVRARETARLPGAGDHRRVHAGRHRARLASREGGGPAAGRGQRSADRWRSEAGTAGGAHRGLPGAVPAHHRSTPACAQGQLSTAAGRLPAHDGRPACTVVAGRSGRRAGRRLAACTLPAAAVDRSGTAPRPGRHGAAGAAAGAGPVAAVAAGRRALQDVMTAIRHRPTVAEAGARLFPNGERHLRPLPALAELHPPELLAESVRIAGRCTFHLGQLRYQYPRELVPDGHTPAAWLRELTGQGLHWRWPGGIPAKAQSLVEKELALIAELGYESYFLTVHDIVRHARSRGILCQGRGSAANSVVCYALGITEIDPDRIGMLFERFVSKERDEPPDIDVDFEHERREEVIQYVFARYGRHRAAITAVASTYHGAGAVRDVARVLGLPPDQVDALARCFAHWSDALPPAMQLREQGFDPGSPLLHRVLVLTAELIGFPRHLSQHPGGFKISEQPLHELVPVENASMEGRTVVQWDKDDLDAVGLLKVDILALGMLSALRRCLGLVERHHGRSLTLATIPPEDPDTYAMIGKADTIGVFQIESRAQMAMLPRLQPRNFYDLVIEVAIVRPGPIQGDMVHPYLRR